MATDNTIFALSSAPGRAGVAVIRVSGPAVPAVLGLMAAPAVNDRQAAFRRVVHPQSGALLDRAVVLFFAAPKSETGEDVAEFQVHGGRAVIAAVLEALALVPGCRMAEAGEFARRAFENGKIDLVEVEGLADLVDAETEAQRRQALAQAGGVLSHLYEGWRTALIQISALIEAAIDFSDEADVAASSLGLARSRAATLLDEINRHLADNNRGEILREGFRVALLGAPNAGKSSLLNALARRQAAIVSEEAGTTRDVIEVRLDLGGYPVIVSDTAGIREAVGGIEQEGIRRSIGAAREADLVLWLTELGADFPPNSISRETRIEALWLIRTKSDLARSFPSPRPLRGEGQGEGQQPESQQVAAPHPNPLPMPSAGAWGEGATSNVPFAISVKTGQGIEALIGEIATVVANRIGDATSPVLTQARHRQTLGAAAAGLVAFLEGDFSAPELRAEDVRQAVHALGRITGRVDVEDVLGEIFGRFCIGK